MMMLAAVLTPRGLLKLRQADDALALEAERVIHLKIVRGFLGDSSLGFSASEIVRFDCHRVRVGLLGHGQGCCAARSKASAFCSPRRA